MIYLKIVYIWIFHCFCGLLFQQKYSKFWDNKLNKLMDDYTPIKADGPYTVKIGEITVWTANEWYSSCYPYCSGLPTVRPSIKTMIRFYEYVEQNAFK